MRHLSVMILLNALVAGPAFAAGNASVQGYAKAAGVSGFDAAEGKRLWDGRHQVGGQERSCATCHGADLKQPGKHARTNKPIEPMAASVNPSRYTDAAKVDKWFNRNCKWTWGRDCTPAERGAILTYLLSQ